MRCNNGVKNQRIQNKMHFMLAAIYFLVMMTKAAKSVHTHSFFRVKFFSQLNWLRQLSHKCLFYLCDDKFVNSIHRNHCGFSFFSRSFSRFRKQKQKKQQNWKKCWHDDKKGDACSNMFQPINLAMSILFMSDSSCKRCIAYIPYFLYYFCFYIYLRQSVSVF